MSEITIPLPCWAPPVFPDEGRLQLTAEQVNANYQKQIVEERQHREPLSVQAERRVLPPCCHSLFVAYSND